MKKIKLLFNIGYIYHKAAFDPVIDILRNNDKYDVWFTIQPEKRKKLLINFIYHTPIIDEWKKAGYQFTSHKEGFDIVITGDTLSHPEHYGRTLLCFLNHGTGIKNVLYRNLAGSINHRYQIFVEGQHRVNSLMNSEVLGKSEVHLIGLPKLDYYFHGKYSNKDAILNKWGLDPNKQTILFAPTYKPTCIYDIKDEIFEQTKDYNLIIKLHPYSWMGKYAPHKQHRIFEKRIGNYSHAVLLPFEEYNIVPYYSVADTIISEASSTVFDFLALGKTGIIFDLQCDKLNHSDGQPILEVDNREFLQNAFIHINSGNQIGEAINKALDPTENMKKAADVYRNELFYKLDGNASKRFVDKIEEMLVNGGHENTPL